jgi:hypothetical protein
MQQQAMLEDIIQELGKGEIHLNYEAFMHALMEFRSTPRTDSYSPSQVFYCRRMKTDAQITAAALRMRTDMSAAESARQRVSDTKRN